MGANANLPLRLRGGGGGGGAPVRRALTTAMASTAPAAPSRWPIMDLVLLICSPPSPSARVIALRPPPPSPPSPSQTRTMVSHSSLWCVSVFHGRPGAKLLQIPKP